MNVVEVLRANVVEARHRVHIAIANADGEMVARIGRTNALTYYRSAAKPFQALPFINSGTSVNCDMFKLIDSSDFIYFQSIFTFF